MKLLMSVVALTFIAVPSFAAKTTTTPPDLMKLCKKECPTATDLKTTMECVEQKEHANTPETATFKKSKCYITHEKFEDKYNEMAGLPKETEEKKN